MMPKEALCIGFAHIPLQLTALRLSEIHQHQAVDNVGKVPVNIKVENLAAQVQVVVQENGQSFMVWLQVRDHLGKLVQILQEGAEVFRMAARQVACPELPPRLDSIRPPPVAGLPTAYRLLPTCFSQVSSPI